MSSINFEDQEVEQILRKMQRAKSALQRVEDMIAEKGLERGLEAYGEQDEE